MRYVMAQDEKNVTKLKEVEAGLTAMTAERERLEEVVKAEVEARLVATERCKQQEQEIGELQVEKASAEENMRELALQIADLDNNKANADRILFEQSMIMLEVRTAACRVGDDGIEGFRGELIDHAFGHGLSHAPFTIVSVQ